VRHEIEDLDGLLLTEEHDIAYCERPSASVPAPQLLAAPATSTWRQTVTPDPVLLFRYSAATFNGHRIHYDRAYAQLTEGYPALVVHGPLMATMLIGLVCRSLPGTAISKFAFKAMAPVFDDRPFHLCASDTEASPDISIWVQDADGRLCIDGHVTLAAGVAPHS
jgi:3-methylfumaryl-CoA hydratase